MGLFDLLGGILSAPIKITGTVVDKTVRSSGAALAGSLDEATEQAQQGADEILEILEALCKDLDE